MVIGTMGLEFGSGNKGCEALGFAFLYMLNDVAKESNEVIDVKICMLCDTNRIKDKLKCDKLRLSCMTLGKITKIKHKIDIFQECNLVYDFTAGDSFSDIYGMRRFLRWTMNKQSVLWSKTPFILGSQTYGPFKSIPAKLWASHVMKKCVAVYARDDLSKSVVEKMTGRTDIKRTVDVAFALPYSKSQYSIADTGKKRIGFNPSGLLWAGGYTQNNQFSMTMDYQEYCRKLIRKLLECPTNEVYLIPHVLYSDLSVVDNDLVACAELAKEFPQLIIAPEFDTPMDAKGYISNMDVFIGARMHATIAAFTSGVATIPVSYSRKFEGLYNSVGYPYVVSGTKFSTDEALNQTLKYIASSNKLSDMVQEKTLEIAECVEDLVDNIRYDLRLTKNVRRR